jgi:PKD repeat protein
MAVADVFKVYLYPDPIAILNDPNYEEGEDITSGIINVDIVSGSDLYEGPQQQIDTGQFTIVSRNPNLDPKININLKYNSAIAFIDERSGEFFRGYVTNVNVQYQRKDDPIITITGTDIFGAMRRTVVDEDLYNEVVALSSGPSWNGVTFEEFVGLESFIQLFSSRYLYVDDLSGSNTVSPGFKFFVASKEGTAGFDTNQIPITGNLGFAPAKYIPQLGENLLDIMNYYATTNLNSVYPKGEFGFLFMNVYPFVKYNGFYWPPQQDPALSFPTYQFSSDPADGRPYRSILIDNGFNNVTNQIDISNEYRFIQSGEITSQSDNLGPYVSQASFEDYAVSKASISTLFPDDDPATLDTLAANYATNIFQVVGFPTDEIQRIEFDNARFEDIENDYTYSNYVVNDFIRIKHQVSDTETINRFYDIAGITHSITPDDWAMSFSFKPSAQEIAFAYQGQLPTLQMNALSGDANFNFTATIADYPTEEIDNVVWDLNQVDANDVAYYYPSAYTGEKFKNGIQRTGLTQTWNFDDDGILAAYDFETNPFGGYGPGFWWVTAYITLINGFTIAVQQGLTVGTPEVTANFGWTQNLTNNFGQVTFINTSTNHETGEVDSYAWDFGDGTTSALENPVHTYNPGPLDTEYEVSLEVYAFGSGGTKIYNTHTETVTLAQPTMVPDYTYTILNSTVTFTNTSTNVGLEEPDAYLWDFGDGTTSTLKNPVKTYSGNEGQSLSFDVKLTTKNIWEQTADVTKTIAFTLIFSVGNYPVNSIRFRSGSGSSVSGTIRTPYMFFLKGLTSETQSNLLYLRPVTKTNSSNIVWRRADGNLETTNPTLFLTRDPSITPTSGYGLSASVSSNVAASYTLSTTLASDAYNLKNFTLNLRDVSVANTQQWDTIFVDIFTNLGWTEVGFFPLGKGPVGKSPLGSAAAITESVKNYVPTRVLPINNLGFNYTFSNNNFTANFTTSSSGPWSWNFGDGTSSTLQNPTKTFANYSTYYVTLTSGAGEITEAVKVIPIIPYGFRFLRFKQKSHDGTHEFDTPYIANFKIQTIVGSYISPILLTNPQSICSRRTSSTSTNWSSGYTGSGTFDPLNTLNLTGNTGLRVVTTNATNVSEWDVVVDFKETINTRVHEITLDAALASVSGYPATVASGISYEVFTTPYTGNFGSTTDPDLIYPGQSWTKIGEINPTGMLDNTLRTYSMTRI